MSEQEVKNIFFLSAPMYQRGISKYSLHLARELARRGYSISVACGPGVLAYQFRDANIHYRQYDHIERRLRPPFLTKKLLHHIREFDADILHVQSSDVSSLGIRLASIARIPMVITVHRLELQGWRMWRLGRKATRVIAVSEAVRENLVNIGHVPKEKIEVIPNGLDLDDYAVSPQSGGATRVVGAIGPLEKIKGLEYFVRAARIILDTMQNVQFLIVGSGDEEKNLRKQVRALGITKNVTFATDIYNYRAILEMMDILVLSSLQEGFGFTVLEAMAAGKPVIASAVGGVYALVREGETGFLVDKGDSKAIAEKTLQLLRDPDLAARMGRRAREIVEKEFNIWEVANKTIEQYKLAVQPPVVV